MVEATPYNPLSKRNLASSIVAKLLNQPPEKLPPTRFVGAGIYAVYYVGKFEPYHRISNANQKGAFTQPIYVGKGIPPGGRKGLEDFDVPHGQTLCKRLSEHSDSIRAASNLDLSDFRCRWLVVDEVFIPLAESLLISHFQPLWNVIVEGFGNHDPGAGRAKGKKPAWDVLHPGRHWAEKLDAAVTRDHVLQLVKKHLEASATRPNFP